jgi:hypothetical protein
MREIDSIDELRRAEAAILAELRALPNGALLFMVDPLSALADAGFALSDTTAAELRRVAGGFEGTLAAYVAIKESDDVRGEKVELEGLFDWAKFE